MDIEIKSLQPEEILNFLVVLAVTILDPTLPTATPCSHSEGCVHHSSTIQNEDAIEIRGRGLKEKYVDSGTVINHTSNEAQANSRTVHSIIYCNCHLEFPLPCLPTPKTGVI